MVKQASATFTVTFEPVQNGTIAVKPALPADGKVPAGTVLTVKATPAEGYALDSVFYLAPGPFGRTAYEGTSPELKVTIDQDKGLGASFIEKSAVEGFTVRNDIVYAKPGVKALKYDVFSPIGARNLPAIIIIHGGGWTANTEEIMRGLARELVRGGQYVVASIDYRWWGTKDGDAKPNTAVDLVNDVFGAIAHFQEHAAEYGADATRLGVTGDSAGGHLSAAAIVLSDKVGTVFTPSYLPRGKSASQVGREITAAIKAAAPSYGVFAGGLLGNVMGSDGPGILKKVSPQEFIPNIRHRAVPQFLIRGSNDNLISLPSVQAYVDALKAAGQTAEYVEVPGAGHAFFDWKPDAGTKATFARFGVPYAAKMKEFFNGYFYPAPLGKGGKGVRRKG